MSPERFCYEKPVRAGLYWIQPLDPPKPHLPIHLTIAEVHDVGVRLRVTFLFDEHLHLLDDVWQYFRWAGPLNPPISQEDDTHVT